MPKITSSLGGLLNLQIRVIAAMDAELRVAQPEQKVTDLRAKLDAQSQNKNEGG